jgi:hypothetical protein
MNHLYWSLIAAFGSGWFCHLAWALSRYRMLPKDPPWTDWTG